MKFYTLVNNTTMEGPLSQIFYIGPSFISMSKNGKIWVILIQYLFLHFIKQKLGYQKSEIWFPPYGSYLWVLKICYSKLIIKQDIPVQKIYVEKSFFKFTSTRDLIS